LQLHFYEDKTSKIDLVFLQGLPRSGAAFFVPNGHLGKAFDRLAKHGGQVSAPFMHFVFLNGNS
jgi:hypothetical protein